ncbi:hypothetical protein CBR_g36526 [Chara braunii]|uniref:Uncharacterized protein n=1 Tax=Chara braunii TaxID=69332 RepID=A0A388LL35_CHABU|nr:hypothetical protein CBR_g36526 [Chara braunii]|eukprot:GBG82997.1 hypothetical protein CBR_g36526 [Chara braunii]
MSRTTCKCFCVVLIAFLLPVFVLHLPPAGKSGAPTSAQNKWYGRSKTYNNKPWALDWVGGLRKLGCGAVIFLSDDNGATWYCCGGVKKSEAGRKTYEGRTFRTFFLTSVFDSAGTDWVKEDKKVSLDLRLLQGYGVKAFSMKAFDVRGDGTEFRMLSPEEFLSKTNVNRVTGCLPVVDSSFRMSKPLVQFNSPMDLLSGVVKRYREDFSKLPPDQQTDCVFLPFEAGSKSSRQTPSATTGKTKQLPGGPSGANLPSPSVRGGRDLAQGSSEATEFDDRLMHQRNVGRENSQGSAIALDEDNDEDEEGGSADPHDDGGNEADVEVGDDNMEDQGGLTDEDAGTPMHGHDISPAGAVGAAIGQPSTSRGISLSQSRSKGGHDSHAMQGPKARKRTRETSPSASTHKRQARTDAVNEARGALTAFQEARPPRKNSQGGRSGGQGGGRGGGGRGGARKGFQRVRPQELWDSGDEGEGVDPRMPEDADEPVQRVAPIDTTRCFFLEYDDQGFATQDVHALHVDVMRIKRIPRGRILFNHRSLSENIVRGIENVIESSISTDPGAWDRPELVLAPVDRNDTVGGQGRRITPTEFLERDPTEFDWDMFHKLGRKRLKVWEYLFRDAPQGRLDGNCIYRKAKVTETLKHYHGALTGAFETFVARCEILKFDLHKDNLMSKDYADLAKSGDGFNPVDSEEDSSGSDLEFGDGKGGEGPGGGMVRSHDEGTVCSHERPVQVAAPSVGSMVAPMEGTGLPNMGICGPKDEDDIDMPGEASKLAPGDPIPPGYCADPTTINLLGGKHARTGEDKWGHDIVWHEGIFEPCIQDGEWKMAVKYTRGWQTFRRMSRDTWLKTTELSIMYRVQKENPGKNEGAVKDKAKELFSVLRDNQQLEYSWKFYSLRTSPSCGSINWKVNQTIGTMEESSSQDAVPLSASPPVPTQAGQREDDGSNVVKTQEVHMTSMPQISVDTTEPSKRMDVSNALSSDAGATYGSLLLTSAALEGTSEMQSESGVALSVPGSQLQPELCTDKGDARVHLTPQGGAVADGGKGEDVEGILHPHNLETLTDDFDYGGEGGNDVVNTRGV